LFTRRFMLHATYRYCTSIEDTIPTPVILL
jgi:hypothetical protein